MQTVVAQGEEAHAKRQTLCTAIHFALRYGNNTRVERSRQQRRIHGARVQVGASERGRQLRDGAAGAGVRTRGHD